MLLLIVVFVTVVGAGAQAAWRRGHGQNSQHTAVAPVPAQTLNRIAWSTPVDLDPQVSGDELLIHYGAPMVTEANTVILPVKTGATDGFRIEAHNPKNGAMLWMLTSDYQLPEHDWTPAYGPVLTLQNRVYYPGGGGLIRYRDNPNQTTGPTGWLAF